jgi:hypothetical protein
MLNSEISKKFPGQPDLQYGEEDPVSLLDLIIAVENKYIHDKGGRFYTAVMNAIKEKPVEVYVYCPSGHIDKDGNMIDVPVSVMRKRIIHTFYSWKKTLCSPFLVSKLFANARSYKFSIDTSVTSDPTNPNVMKAMQTALPSSMQIKISDRPFRKGTEEEIEADAEGRLPEYYAARFAARLDDANVSAIRSGNSAVNIAVHLPNRVKQ